MRFGVRAVAADGKTKSQTSWTDYEEIPYNSPKTDVVIDKAVVKPGETFTLKFEDYLIQPAREWSLSILLQAQWCIVQVMQQA